MALISEKNKFIFFHLYKCGGMSLRKFLQDNVKGCIELQGGHSCPKDMMIHYQGKSKEDKFKELFKFTFIRNPYDFMVSTFFYGKTYTNHFMHDDIVSQNMDMEKFIPYYFDVREQHKDPKVRPFGSNKVVTFKDWLLDDEGNQIVDFVGKIENYDLDMKIISENIGIEEYQVPVVNVNPNRSKNYREYYNDASKKMIEKHFEWELDKYKYTF
jgi:hypothetical protein